MTLRGKILTWAGRAWLWLAVAFILFNYALIIYYSGWSKFAEIANPFNLWNFVAVVITIAPGIALLKLGEYLGSRQEAK